MGQVGEKAATTMKARCHAKQPGDIRQTDESRLKKLQKKGNNQVQGGRNKAFSSLTALQTWTVLCCLCQQLCFYCVFHLSAPVRRDINEYQQYQSDRNSKWVREHKNKTSVAVNVERSEMLLKSLQFGLYILILLNIVHSDRAYIQLTI